MHTELNISVKIYKKIVPIKETMRLQANDVYIFKWYSVLTYASTISNNY